MLKTSMTIISAAIALAAIIGCTPKPPNILTRGPTMESVLNKAAAADDGYRQEWVPVRWVKGDHLISYYGLEHKPQSLRSHSEDTNEQNRFLNP